MSKQMAIFFLLVALVAVLMSGCCCCKMDFPQEKESTFGFDTRPTATQPVSDTENTTTPSEWIPETTPAENAVPAETTKQTEATTPVESTIAPTVAPNEPTTSLAPWKTAYLNYIEELQDEKAFSAYRLVHVDSDGIPELFISGSCEAAGSIICSYKNGKVIDTHLRRLYGAYYLPESGLVYNCNGNMGYYTTDIYRLSGNGFTLLFNASQEEYIQEYVDEDGNYQVESLYKYYLYDGDTKTEVTEEAFNAARTEIFDVETAKPLHPYDDSGLYTYDAFIKHITNW